MPSIRSTFIYGFLVCFFLLAVAAYLQVVKGLLPCPLCVVQRGIVLLLGLWFLVGLIFHESFGLKIHAIVLAFFALLGVLSAGRQLWLQYLPHDPSMPCAPDLNYMLSHLPVGETLKILVAGSGDCARIQWQALGLSIPGWTFLFFIAIFIVALIQYRRV